MPRGLTRRVDVKDDVTATLSIKDAANSFCCPPLCEGMLLEERTEGF